MGGGQPGGSASGVDSYDAVTEYTEDIEVDGENYSSTGTDEKCNPRFKQHNRQLEKYNCYLHIF